tara:strand:- start:293 stop:502 length:210 start_codon:yes stop_codon:yes gene_type:complete
MFMFKTHPAPRFYAIIASSYFSQKHSYEKKMSQTNYTKWGARKKNVPNKLYKPHGIKNQEQNEGSLFTN